MTWSDLFERAEAYEVTVEEIRRALDARREANAAAGSDGDEDDG